MQKQFLVVFLLAFSSGLPFALTGMTLQAWYATQQVDIKTVALLSLVGQPYLFKFLWAPFLDRFVWPVLGRRRSWMLLTQCLLLLSVGAMAYLSPAQQPLMLAGLATLVAFFSATQDIVIDAHRMEILSQENLGLGAAFYATGYRLAVVVSGGVALIFADQFGWQKTYLLMAALMSVGILATYLASEPAAIVGQPKTLKQAVVEPFREFLSRPWALGFLCIVVFYKLGDTLTQSLLSVFLLRELHFSLTEVGAVTKGIGLVMGTLGAFIGGFLVKKQRIYRALWIAGWMQAMASLTYACLGVLPKHLGLMMSAVGIEYLCSGIATATFLAFLMSLCDKRYTATQFALLSAVASIGRVYSGVIAGTLITQVGWIPFYMIASIISVIGVGILFFMRFKIYT